LYHSRSSTGSFVVNLISRYKQEPRESHWKEAKRIFRYVKGTHELGVQFSSPPLLSSARSGSFSPATLRSAADSLPSHDPAV